MSGFYLNELLLKLTRAPRRHPQLFDRLRRGAGGSCSSGAPEARTLRIFEKRLLADVGLWARSGPGCASGAPLEPERYYHFRADRGLGAQSRRPRPRIADHRCLARRGRAGRCAVPQGCAATAARGPERMPGRAGTSSSREVMAALRQREVKGVSARRLDRAGREHRSRGDAAPGTGHSLSGSRLCGAHGRAGGRRQHHAASARGSPPHPGSGPARDPRRDPDTHEPGNGGHRRDARDRRARAARGLLPGTGEAQ